MTDPERPFRRCTLLPLPARYDREDHYRAANKAAHVAYADLLTSVGRAASADTGEPPANPLTLVGVQRLSWPRAQTVRTAGWLLTRKTLQAWTTKADEAPGLVPATAIDAVWADRKLDRNSILTAITANLDKVLRPPAEQRVEEVARGIASGEYSSRTGFLRLFDLLGRPRTDETNSLCEVGKRARGQSQRPGAMPIPSCSRSSCRWRNSRAAASRSRGSDSPLARRGLEDKLAEADRDAAAIEEQAWSAFGRSTTTLWSDARHINDRST